MADAYPQLEIPSSTDPFLLLERELTEKLDAIISAVEDKRQQLTERLHWYRDQFRENETKRESDIAELSAMRDSLDKSSVKSNRAMQISKNTHAAISNEISQLRMQTVSPFLNLAANIDIIIQQIEVIDIVETKIDLRKKVTPVFSFSRFGDGKEDYKPAFNRLHFHEKTKHLFVTDLSNNCIRVFNLKGELLSQFGNKQLAAPCSIEIVDNSIYITCLSSDSICQFTLNGYSFIRNIGSKGIKPGHLNSPMSICAHKGTLFVGERGNKRISVFDLRLKFKLIICDNAIQPLQIQPLEDNLAILSNVPLGIFFFTFSGEFIKKLPIVPQQYNEVLHTRLLYATSLTLSFYIHNGLVLITNHLSHCIDVYTMKGQLLHSIGGQFFKPNLFHLPCSVISNNEDEIIVYSLNPNNVIQII